MSPTPSERALSSLTHRVVLVDDDAADRLLFVDSVRHADAGLRVTAVPGLDELGELMSAAEPPRCVVLDLGLSGLGGLDTLDVVLERHPDVAIVVLTGWGDEEAGAAAVARGAQDYLVKGRASGEVIVRSIRFAIERKRYQVAVVALESSRLREAEQARLERALLAVPAVERNDLRVDIRYQAARPGLVSGDFCDVVECADGSVRAVIGDVSGHGSDEAALGVALRSAWRALVLAGLDGAATIDALDSLIRKERVAGDEFATICDLSLTADLGAVTVRSAGHPQPVLAGMGVLVDSSLSTPAGVDLTGDRARTGTTHPLPDRWELVLFSDGLFEVRDRSTGLMLDVCAVEPAVLQLADSAHLDPDTLIAAFADRTDEGWRDDVAVVLISRIS